MSRAVLLELNVEGEAYMVVCAPPVRPRALAVLTRAELAVVERWLEGRSMRDIAAARGASPRTVAKQLESAYDKLGVSSRAELARLVHDPATGARWRPPRT